MKNVEFLGVVVVTKGKSWIKILLNSRWKEIGVIFRTLGRFFEATYSRVRNKCTPMFIDFWKFFQGIRSYYGLKRLKFYYISLHIGGDYVYSFFKFTRSYKFIQGAAFIPDSRVGILWTVSQKSGWIWNQKYEK